MKTHGVREWRLKKLVVPCVILRRISAEQIPFIEWKSR